MMALPSLFSLLLFGGLAYGMLRVVRGIMLPSQKRNTGFPSSSFPFPFPSSFSGLESRSTTQSKTLRNSAIRRFNAALGSQHPQLISALAIHSRPHNSWEAMGSTATQGVSFSDVLSTSSSFTNFGMFPGMMQSSNNLEIEFVGTLPESGQVLITAVGESTKGNTGDIRLKEMDILVTRTGKRIQLNEIQGENSSPGRVIEGEFRELP